MIAALHDILPKARAKGYAVGAFNTSNLETTQAIIAAAEELKSPVIVQTSEKAIDYAGLQPLRSLVLEIAHAAKVPVVLHLDHGATFALAKKCLEAGYPSVMIDTSRKPFRENVYDTRKTVLLAHTYNASVEGELGPIAGQEDYVKTSRAFKTDPEHARMFAQQTNVDALAVSVGLAHGVKIKKEKLDVKLLREIADLVETPLVLHGASQGASDSEIKHAISLGVAKINIDTDIRLAWTAALKDFLNTTGNKAVYDPRAILAAGTAAVKKEVKRHVQLFGSAGKK